MRLIKVWPPLVTRLRDRRDERGAASVELVLIVPVVVLLAAVLVAGWRIGWARTNVQAAAAAGARIASQQRSGALAAQRALDVVTADLDATRVVCQGLGVASDVSQFARPAGTVAQVSVDVSCTVGLSDLLIPGMPGSIHVSAHATERLDTYRERQP